MDVENKVVIINKNQWKNQGLHLRNNRLSGNRYNLNKKALKILFEIMFSPFKQSREELMQKTSFSKQDIEKQIKLLLIINFIKQDSRFPSFPSFGWRVYTNPEKKQQILRILKNHGFQNLNTIKSREILGDYYPTGMDLEGFGVQQDRNHSYTSGVPIIDELKYRQETIKAMKEWKKKKPFRPKEFSEESMRIKKDKFQWILKKLSNIYHIRVPIFKVGNMTAMSWSDSGSSGSSSFNRSTNTLTMVGKFSVTTFLHEFAHARGFDERDAIIWSGNLFKRVYPILFNRLKRNGHLLVVSDDRFQD